MHYKERIAVAIGCDDPATVAVVERLMRDERSVLDGLSPEQFRRASILAFGDARAWQKVGAVGGLTFAEYCSINSLPVPVMA